MGKHDPSSEKKVYAAKYFNNHSLNDSVDDILNLIDEKVKYFANRFVMEQSDNPNYSGKYTWRGESYFWPVSMNNIKVSLRTAYDYDKENFFRWWLDKYVEEYTYSLWNYLFDRARWTFTDDTEEVDRKKRKTADQKADEYATTVVSEFEDAFK